MISTENELKTPELAKAPVSGVLPQQILLRAAQVRAQGDSSGCALLVSLLSMERDVRNSLNKVLSPLGLSEFKFRTLICLFALDPMQPTSTDLAYHAGVSRSAMTDILDQMEQRGWIRRQRHGEDRRVILVELLEEGRKLAAHAIQITLQAIDHLAAPVSKDQGARVQEVCALIQKQAANLSEISK